MKKILLAVMISLVTLQLAAQDTTTLYINKIKRSNCILAAGETNATLNLDKKFLRGIKEMSVQVQSKWNNKNIYAKRLELESDTSVFFPESKKKPAFYMIAHSYIVKKLKEGKTVNLYLVLNPANPRLSVPSRRIYLGTFAVK